MYRFILNRLLVLIPILLGVIFIVFFIMSFTPGSPGRIILGAQAKQEDVDALNIKLGYDKPFLVRYADYVIKAVQGDFGDSYITGKPVFNDIFTKFPITLRIAILSVIFSAVLGIPLGIIAAIRRHTPLDMTITVFALLMASVPTFWLGLICLLVFALLVRILPSFGISTPAHYVLPLICMVLPTSAGIMRLTKSTMLETIKADYIRTARAKGVPEKVVIFRHSLRNALLPVITVLGMSFAGLLGGSVFVEKVFAIPGLGNLILKSIAMKDIPMVMGCTVFLATLFCLIMLILDIIYALMYPEIKARFSR